MDNIEDKLQAPKVLPLQFHWEQMHCMVITLGGILDEDLYIQFGRRQIHFLESLRQYLASH